MDDLNDSVWESCDNFISKSRLSTFSFCPLQFKKKYVDGIRDTDFNYAITIGSRFHQFADTFFDVAPQYPVDDWEDFIHPEFNDNEQHMLKWFISQERERLDLFNGDIDLWMPIARECKIVDATQEIRGIIDRIDKIDTDLLLVVEYKTSKSIYKPSLQKEFGFYKVLMKNDPRFKGYRVIGCVINPRLRKIEFMNPSRETTIEKQILNLRESISTGIFKPTCTGAKFAMCGLCSSCEEADLYQEYKRVDELANE